MTRLLALYMDAADAQRRSTASRRDEADYQAGIADGLRHSENRRLFGEAVAEEMALADELARYNRGED